MEKIIELTVTEVKVTARGTKLVLATPTTQGYALAHGGSVVTIEFNDSVVTDFQYDDLVNVTIKKLKKTKNKDD